MYVDKNFEFSDAQAVTVTAISSNVYDLLTKTTGGATIASTTVGNTRMDVGAGEQPGSLWLIVQTQTTITDVGSDATLAVTLETADDAGLSSNNTVIATSGTLAFATYATAGSRIMAVQLPSVSYRRWLGLRFTVASGPFTAGAIDAFLTATPQLYTANKSGFTVQ